MNLNAFIALARKDLVLYFSNRRALVMSIAAPIVIAAFFGALFGSDQKPSRVPVAVADLDHSALSAKLVANLRADPTFELQEADEATGAALVKQGKLRAAIVLPAGLGQAAPAALFGRGDKPVITVHHDPSQAMVLPVVRGLLAQHVMEAVAQTLFSGDTAGKYLAEFRRDVAASPSMSDAGKHDLLAMFESIERVQQGAAAAADAPASAAAGRGVSFSLPFDLRTEEATARAGQAYNSYAHSFAGMGVQFILFSGIELGVGLLLARRLGLWKRLRAAPVSRSLLLGSRIASGAVTALVLLAIIYAAAIAVFGVRIQGSVVGFVGVAIAFSLLTASFGLLIAALGRTPEATRGLAIFATLIMVMLGGAWVPTFVFPPWLQTVSLAVPTRWAVDGLDAMTWRGMGASAAVGPIVVMLAFSAVFAALAVWRFDWEETPSR
jgi:ABC-2 type transport system permease protein